MNIQIYYNNQNPTVPTSPCCNLKEQLNKASHIDQKGNIIFGFFQSNRAKYADFVKDICLETIEEAKIKNSLCTLAWCYLSLGWLYLDSGRFTESLNYFEEAEKYFNKCGDRLGLARTLNGKGVLQNNIGNYNESLKTFLKASEIVENTDNINLYIAILINIATLFSHLKLYKEAEEYFDICLHILKEPSINRGILLTNFGGTYALMGEYALAEKYIEEALEYWTGENNLFFKAHSLVDLGILKEYMGSLDEAKEHYKQSLAICQQNNIPKLQLISVLNLASIETKKENYRDALKFLLEVLDLINTNQLKSYEPRALLNLGEVYSKLGRYQEAYIAFQKGLALDEKIFDRQLTNQMGVMKVKQTHMENLIFKKLYHQINVISQIGQKITATFNLEKSGKILSEHIKELLEIDYLLIGLYSEDKKWLEYKYYLQKEDIVPGQKVPLQENCFANDLCLFNKSGLLVNDLGTYNFPCGQGPCHNMPMPPDVNSFLSCPLLIKDKPLGIIAVYGNKKNLYGQPQLDTLKALGAYLAISFYNGQLFAITDKLATYDSLTGTLNRAATLERAEEEFKRYERSGEPFSIIMLDIDKFKSFNDTYGHASGDLILKKTADLFKNNIRTNDILGRIGGDEFLLILPKTSLADGYALAKRILTKALEKNHLVGAKKLRIGMSFGITQVSSEDKHIDEVIDKADKALYAAKKAGGCIIYKFADC